MPRNNEVKTLSQCCYRRIALSFEKYWMKDFKQNFHDLPRLLYVIGPFDHLTEGMIQCLLETLIKEKCLQRPHFTLLLKPQITHLDLMNAGLAANNDSVAKIVSYNCPKLVFLGLHGMNNISARGLADLASLLPGLRSLDLSQTGCNDQVLSNIGYYCLGLTNLNIRNTKTTNSGVFSLCRACHPDQGCKKLVRLTLYGTLIDCKGALHCLQNLQYLQYLGFDDTCKLIELDFQERTGQGLDTTAYGLRNINAHGIKVPDVSQESITLACQLCDRAIEARLFCGICDNTILSVRNMRYLTKLGIGNNFTQVLTFQNGVLPVLKEIGNQLLDLTLADVNDFDLLAIGYFCPNIQSLSMLISEEDEDRIPLVSNMYVESRFLIFSKLNNLEVNYPLTETNIQKCAFITLFKNAKALTKINLQYVSWMTTEIFLQILEDNPMVKLKELKLVFCDNIDGEVLQKLVYEANDLSSVNVYKCKHISRRDYEHIKKYGRKNNLDLTVVWDTLIATTY